MRSTRPPSTGEPPNNPLIAAQDSTSRGLHGPQEVKEGAGRETLDVLVAPSLKIEFKFPRAAIKYSPAIQLPLLLNLPLSLLPPSRCTMWRRRREGGGVALELVPVSVA